MAERPAEDPRLAEKKGVRILLIDDVPSARKVVRKLLGFVGFENVVEAASGAEALSLSQADSFELIVSDFHLSDMGADGLITKIRESESMGSVPVLIVTGDTAAKVYHSVSGEENVLYMWKPFGVKDLQDKLVAALSPEVLD